MTTTLYIQGNLQNNVDNGMYESTDEIMIMMYRNSSNRRQNTFTLETQFNRIVPLG